MTKTLEQDRFDPKSVDRFRVGHWEVEPGLHQVTGPAGTRKLEPRVMDLLVYLACHAGSTVAREQLVADVWHGAAVIDAAITRAVSTLRSALDDDAQAPRYVQTVPRRGYQFIADVGPVAPTHQPPHSRLAQSALGEGGTSWIAKGVGLLFLLFITVAILGRLERPRTGQRANDPQHAGSEIELADRDRARFATEKTIAPRALHDYLKGRYFWSRRTPESLRRSRVHFEAAVALEPDYSLAWAGLADALLQLNNYQVLPATQALPAAHEAAKRAVYLAPDQPEGHTALGLAKLLTSWDFAGAEASYRTAIALGPAYANVRQLYAELLSMTGRHEAALQEIELAWRLDPLSPVIHGVWGLVLHGAGRFEDMLRKSEESLQLDPGMRWLHRYRAYALERLGRIEEATREVERLAIQSPERTAALRADLDADGLAAYYRWELEAYAQVDRSPTLIAEAYAGLGRDEQALIWIEKAIAERGEYWLHLYRSPAFDRLRSDPRLAPRLLALGLELPWPPTGATAP